MSVRSIHHIGPHAARRRRVDRFTSRFLAMIRTRFQAARHSYSECVRIVAPRSEICI